MAKQPKLVGNGLLSRVLSRNLEQVLDDLYGTEKGRDYRIAQEFGIDRSMFRRILNRSINAKLSQVEELAEKLKIDPLDLLRPGFRIPKGTLPARGRRAGLTGRQYESDPHSFAGERGSS